MNNNTKFIELNTPHARTNVSREITERSKRSRFILEPDTPFELLLQLHAKTAVSNPYTHNVDKDQTYSADIKSNLPSTETFIFKNATYGIEFTVPNGVSVLKISIDANSWGGDVIYATIYNSSNNKKWGDNFSTAFVGVTSDKFYRLYWTVQAGSSEDYYYQISISYSQSINSHSVDVTDY